MINRLVPEHCPRCSGTIYLNTDCYGWYKQCFQCGYTHDLESADMPQEALTRNRITGQLKKK